MPPSITTGTAAYNAAAEAPTDRIQRPSHPTVRVPVAQPEPSPLAGVALVLAIQAGVLILAALVLLGTEDDA